MRFFQRLSLRQSLPLFLTALTATSLLAAGALAWGQVGSASRAAAETRLKATARELANLSGGGIVTRAALEREVGAHPAIRAALQGSTDSAQVAAALDRLATNADSTLPIQLWAADRRLVFGIGRPLAPDPDPLPPFDTVRAYGPFHRVGDVTVYWIASPLEEGGRVSGWIAQRRRLGSPQAAEQMGNLLGGTNVNILIGSQSDTAWVDLSGVPRPGPNADHPTDTSFTYVGPDGARTLAWAVPLANTPWMVLVDMPAEAVEARSRAFLADMAPVALLLIALTGLVGWVVSGRLTEPLAELGAAADAMAAGDYRRRVGAEGQDEAARLGRAFNSMAEHVARSNDALRHRLDEARALAERLEEANVSAERAREEAQAANRTKSEFLAIMSHEIRTPINAMMGYTGLLQAGIPDPPSDQQRGYLERISRSSRLLISLVDDVLDFSRLESGQLRVTPGTGSAGEALLAAQAALEPDAERRLQTLSTRCPADLWFQGDDQRVQQILLNLMSNAIKFTPAGGTVAVACERSARGPDGAEREDGWLRIDVRDTGMGIAPDQLARIFEPFVQAETGLTREHGGVGLGLAISRRLAAMMGGEITVESAPGTGSCFTLWLVAAPALDRGSPAVEMAATTDLARAGS